jgi:hypothetical protein
MGKDPMKRIARSKVDEYRAGAARWEHRAKKTRNQADREWQICLARAYLLLAEVEAEAEAEPSTATRPSNKAA